MTKAELEQKVLELESECEKLHDEISVLRVSNKTYEEELKALRLKYRKSVDHSVSLLLAIQDLRRAERHLFAVCGEVHRLPDRVVPSQYLSNYPETQTFDVRTSP